MCIKFNTSSSREKVKQFCKIFSVSSLDFITINNAVSLNFLIKQGNTSASIAAIRIGEQTIRSG